MLKKTAPFLEAHYPSTLKDRIKRYPQTWPGAMGTRKQSKTTPFLRICNFDIFINAHQTILEHVLILRKGMDEVSA